MPRPEGRPELQATEIEGMGKEARRSRAVVLAGLMMQTKLLMLSAPGGDGKTTIYAVIVGEDKADAELAHDLAESYGLRRDIEDNSEEWRLVLNGPDLSPDMARPMWVGRCRKCGEIVAGAVETIIGSHDYEQSPTLYTGENVLCIALGRMVAQGLVVDRVPGPVTLGECRCDSKREKPTWEQVFAEGGVAP